MLLVFLPVIDYPCFRTLDYKAVGRNVPCDCGACSRGCVFTYVYGSDKVGVAADKGIIPYIYVVLVYSVIVCGYAAAAEIYPSANGAVPKIGKVCNAGIYADKYSSALGAGSGGTTV